MINIKILFKRSFLTSSLTLTMVEETLQRVLKITICVCHKTWSEANDQCFPRLLPTGGF